MVFGSDTDMKWKCPKHRFSKCPISGTDFDNVNIPLPPENSGGFGDKPMGDSLSQVTAERGGGREIALSSDVLSSDAVISEVLMKQGSGHEFLKGNHLSAFPFGQEIISATTDSILPFSVFMGSVHG